MMEEKKTPKLELEGADPREPFYVMADLYIDGSVDICSEGKDPLSLEEAIARACEYAEDHGGEYFVIECRVIRKIKPRTPLVSIFKTKPRRSIKPRPALGGDGKE